MGRPAVGTNRIYISHDNSGNLAIYSNSEFGGSNFALVTAWSPTAGTEYNIELNYDITGGATRVFIDGVQLGGTNVNTGTRDSDISVIKIGASHSGSLLNNFSIRRVEVFSSVQHTANFTVEAPQEFIYLDSKILVPIYNVPGPGSIQSINLYSVVDTGSTQYTLGPSDAIQYYWNGAAWALSDQTYAQSNDEATIQAHLLDLVSGLNTVVVAVYFTDTNIQSNVDEIDVTYTSQEYSKDNPTIEINDKWRIEELVSFVETSILSGNDLVKYALKKDNDWYYLNGTTWTISNGTYAQSSLASEITANIGTFTTDNVIFGIKLFLHSDDGLTTPYIDSLSVTYDYGGETPSSIDRCVVSGYYETDDPIIIELSNDFVLYKTNRRLSKEYTKKIVYPNANAENYWEVELIETENMTPKTYWNFNFNDGKIKSKNVPNQEVEPYEDLT